MSRAYNPESASEVREIVRQTHRAGRQLKVVSTDRNWGYRFPDPLPDGTDLLVLSRLTRIRNIDRISATHPVALIEPGVTQGQLADALADRRLPLFINVTGSVRDTSIIGNALDGGIGYFGSRRDDMFGLEVILPDGEVLHTGMRGLGDRSPLAHLQRYGPGPSLDGLFYQSKLGIVVSACMHLRNRPASQVAVSIRLHPKKGSFVGLVNGLAFLRRSEVLTGVIHLANRARTHSTLLPGLRRNLKALGVHTAQLGAEAGKALALAGSSEWSALVGVGGTQRQVRAVLHEVRRVLAGHATVSVLSASRLNIGLAATQTLLALPVARRAHALLKTVRPLHGLATGTPTDEAVQALLEEAGEFGIDPRDLDRSNVGLIYLSPILPLDGVEIRKTLVALEAIASRSGFSLYVTVNIDSRLTATAVTNVVFDRNNPQARSRAESMVDEMYLHLAKCGLDVYRAHERTQKLMQNSIAMEQLRHSLESLSPRETRALTS